MKKIGNLDIMIEDKIQETKLFLESKNCNQDRGYYADWLHQELTLFLNEVEMKPGFDRDTWGMGTALSTPVTIDAEAGKSKYGYVMLVKAGPPLYDVGDDREKYMQLMNVRAFLFESDHSGDLLGMRKLDVKKELF